MGLFCGLSGTPPAQSHPPTSQGTRSPLINPGPTPSSSPQGKTETDTTAATTTTTAATTVCRSPISPKELQQQLSSGRGPVDDDPRDDVNVTNAQEQSARKVFQRAFKKYHSSDEKVNPDSAGIMELLNGNPVKTSPVLTIKRGGRLAGQWQEFIDREQSSVDQLIKDSFAVFCRDLNENNDVDVDLESKLRFQRRNSSESNNRPNMSSLPRASKLFLARSFSNGGAGTLPRSPASKMDSSSLMTSPRLPKGIEELELLYAPMKNLSAPLPNARKYSGTAMPQPHPLFDLRNELKIVEDFERRKLSDDDQVKKDNLLTQFQFMCDVYCQTVHLLYM